MYKLRIKQPQGFYIIAFGELCERFSYYGAQTLLVLCLTQFFHLNDDISYELYGAYATFSYALPVLGALLADRFLGLRQAVIFGGLFLIIGNLLMASQQINCFYMGLALTACGTGLYKPNSTSFIGKLYPIDDIRRESGFTLFYMGMNIGATISPFVYGFTKQWGYQFGYLISAFLLFINWSFFLFTHLRKNKINLKLSALSKKQWAGYLLILLLISVVNILFLHPAILNDFLLFFAGIALITLISLVLKYKNAERNQLLGILILCFFGMCFFASSLQVGSSINLFIERDVYRTFLSWQIPTIIFTSLYPLSVIITAPFIVWMWSCLARLNKEPSVSVKIIIGLVFASISFMFFMLAALSSKQINSYLPIVWILLANLALGAGEVCLMPAMFSTISRFAPEGLKSTMIGVWFLFIAFGGYLSNLAAKLSNHQIDNINTVASAAIYSNAFMKVSIATLLIACILFIFTSWIKVLIETNKF